MPEIVKLKVLTEEEKANIATLMAAGTTCNQIAKRIGRSFKIVKKYLETDTAQVEILNIKERLVTKYQQLAENCVDRLLEEEVIEKASPKDLAMISGIAVDKSRLLSDESTENVAVVVQHSSTEELIEESRRLSIRLKELQAMLN